MEKEPKALLFLGIAILCFLFIILTGPLVDIQNSVSLLVQVFGVLLIIWAVITKRVSEQHHHNLPDGFFFVTHGPYEIIRHPVYAGFILIIASFLQYDYNVARMAAFIIFLAMIGLKIIREEYTMEHKIHEFKEYKKNTKCLIPYLF